MTTDEENVSKLSAMKFCSICSAKRHRKLDTHKPVPIIVDKFGGKGERLLMELFAVISIKTSHYVSFAKDGAGMWYWTDSMADREGGEKGHNIPEIKLCPEIADFLEGKSGQEQLMHLVERNQSLPDPLNRFFEDAYLCMYQPKVMTSTDDVHLLNTSSDL